jgi:hypothetical protein
VPATLTFSGELATIAIGVDVFKGFQQQLVTVVRVVPDP